MVNRFRQKSKTSKGHREGTEARKGGGERADMQGICEKKKRRKKAEKYIGILHTNTL